MDGGSSLPVQQVPHDSLRQGLPALKDDAEVSHPVEAIQGNLGKQAEASRHAMLANLYGSALPARMQIEKQILGRVQRLPGLPSSNVLLESLTGELDDFGVEAYVGNPSAPEGPQADLHSQMEARLQRGSGVSTTRAFF
mmetsp:Transcript_5198/g.14915  ORF Transcript_5198/g.14915 Transcript_5198/m.14915 type:complete len:139 (+) Transcript_5198:235-651(+)